MTNPGLQLPQPPTSERLRFSTAVLRLLGEELNPSPDQGILELIKNSYDADATRCSVELKGVHIKGGAINLADNGIGMTAKEIRNGWLIVGDSMKSRNEKSPSGRLLVGSKGLGRLGALRLGRKVEMITRPKSEKGIQYRVGIDWSAFDHARVVEDVELAIQREKAPVGTSHGTEILISQLPTPWRESDIRRLARAILLLRDPFTRDQTFQATLKAKEFSELEQLAHEGYFGECDFHLMAKIDSRGHASAEVQIAGGKRIFAGKHDDIADGKNAPPYRIPPLTFELWEFNLSSKGFAIASIGGAVTLLLNKSISIDEVLLNSDASKDSDTFGHLRYALAEANTRNGTRIERRLTTSTKFNRKGAKIEVLHPSDVNALAGVGGKSTEGKYFTSNSMSAAIRVSRSPKASILLAGDIEYNCLDEWKASHTPPSATVLVFPHHGGLPGTSDESEAQLFAYEITGVVNPDVVIFSNHKTKFNNPHDCILRAISKAKPEISFACTQLPQHLHSLVKPSGQWSLHHVTNGMGMAEGSICLVFQPSHIEVSFGEKP